MLIRYTYTLNSEEISFKKFYPFYASVTCEDNNDLLKLHLAGAAQEIGGDKLGNKGFDPGMLEGVTCSMWNKNWSTNFWKILKEFIPGSTADDVKGSGAENKNSSDRESINMSGSGKRSKGAYNDTF